ncbi:hypothetical protein COT97_01020 [Candidatus Falkowbacteria bacterium CG10_big_fil_rev_8_21_14_0_10_39_11]|uniref:GerMN domain-containing protein n=1 Tax=Candidatus Falkowbacteria bacterium CG10_big_fil_rev_8_21_14_0_10_39_11 TaxID=1974565 RepID=A0A2H0V834_9BACT|nr:MAG: hypothetical protein COT97_01020 [Candidatus Falkowbacteria bacterium CG10_big_fil_rev_8_21_14_0_10_39_11]
MNKNYLLLIVIVCLAALIGVLSFILFANQANSPDVDSVVDGTQVEVVTPSSPTSIPATDPTSTPDEPVVTVPSDLIIIDTPKFQDTVSNPIQFSGQARGSFYFEGDFPVRLQTPGGDVIATGVASAQGDWMTDDFVPFSGEIVFNHSDIVDSRMNLVFERNNPSGQALTTNDRKAIAIYIDTVPEQVTFKIYFHNDNLDSNPTSCADVYPVTRAIPYTQAVARAALNALLGGPDGLEARSGYTTEVPTATINSLSISNGTLFVDFKGNLTDWNGGSCRTEAMKAQITATASQFSTVNNVKISVNGESTFIFQP